MLLGVYAQCLAGLLAARPLLLDEIVDLVTLHRGSMLSAIPLNAGGVPLSYWVRWAVIHVLGESSFSARLPSALFSLLACVGIYFLANRLGLKRPILAVILFAIIPLQFRYALEARAYSQALCLGVWTTVLFFRWIDHPTGFARPALYGLCIVAGLYTQPYLVFVPLAHLAWLARSRQMLGRVAIATLGAALAFIPWAVYALRIWNEQAAAIQARWTVGWSALILVLHEISGTGYLGTALVTAGVVAGLRSDRVRAGERSFWLFYLVFPIAGALAGDIAFGYFVAIRQMIFVIAPMTLLFAAGCEWLAERSAPAGALVMVALMGASLYEDARLFLARREDWQGAARLLVENTNQNGCVFFIPQNSADVYAYLEPGLKTRECDPGQLPARDSVAISVIPYGDAAAELYATHRRELERAGLRKVAELNPAGPRIEIYHH
jgi:hypothetical protein